MAEDSKVKCVIVGAGPVGALSALYAAKRGWDVEVYELRGDLRDASTTPLNFTKSINLALSIRGIEAMKNSGSTKLLDAVMSETVPMYGRMIHGQDSSGQLTEQSQQYDVHGRFNSAVDRGNLNKIMLDELSDLPNVKLHFHHRLASIDFDKRKAWFEQKKSQTPQTADGAQSLNTQKPKDRQTEIEVDFDLILGCDGAHSAVRFHMMKFVRMNYEQSYIDTLWCEFTIPPLPTRSEAEKNLTSPPRTTTPSAHSGFATSPNHLHIWPSSISDAMFIAIPSIDKSFTCTLFASASTFAHLRTTQQTSPTALADFFTANFPGALDLLGGPSIIQHQFNTNPHLPLISIKCSPHIHTSSGAILGDAAHAMVPFYGQGMNAGLEDVQKLFAHLPLYPSSPADREKALQAYNSERVPDAHTINDLALNNYWEMHSGTTSPLRLARKRLEETLSSRLLNPFTGFATEYERVSFSCQRYSELVHATRRQSWLLLSGVLGTVLLPVLGWGAWWVWRLRRVSDTGGWISRGIVGLGSLGERVGRAFA
ncbi:hypothetical protein MBLNU230_g8495t1 [Neophaeotheca triangularis]